MAEQVLGKSKDGTLVWALLLGESKDGYIFIYVTSCFSFGNSDKHCCMPYPYDIIALHLYFPIVRVYLKGSLLVLCHRKFIFKIYFEPNHDRNLGSESSNNALWQVSWM